MCSATETTNDDIKKSCCESIGDRVDSSISGFFFRLGNLVSRRPKTTVIVALLISILCAGGMAKLNTENRPEELWVPQNTIAEEEGNRFLGHFPPTSRFESVIVSSSSSGGDSSKNNVLTKENLIDVMKMHSSIQNGISIYNGTNYTYTDLCTVAGGSCSIFNPFNPICLCLVISPLKVWNYDITKLQEDNDYMATLNTYGDEPKDFMSVFGNPQFDSNGTLLSAKVVSISYFFKDQSYLEGGCTFDPIDDGLE